MIGETRLSKVSSRVTVQDGVYEQLRQALMWGSFEPSQAVTIASLAAEFGTSHMPVREALRRLAAENGLEIARNGSARVPDISRTRLDDICRVRVALEGLATELATPRMNAADIDRCLTLAREHEALGQEGKIYEMLRKNQEFHFTIYELSGSETLPQMIETLWLRLGPYMRLLSNHVRQQVDKGIIHPLFSLSLRNAGCHSYWRCEKAGSLMVQDIEATQRLLQKLC